MGKVDWRGISMAIGQVNQLLEPSYKQKKEMELADWKTKEIWSQGFEELTKLDNEIDKSWDELGVKTEEIANIDLSLSSKVPERDLTNGGLFINQALGMKTLDGMRQVISDGNKKLEEVQNYIKEGTGTIASYKSGNELLQNIPLTYDENSKLPAHLKGLAEVDEDGEITGYSNFDSDDDGRLSTGEYKAAKTQVINMLAGRDDLQYTLDPEAFEVGFNNALDEQKENEAIDDTKNAQKILKGKLAKQQIDYDTAALNLKEKRDKYKKSQESIENMKIESVIEEIDFLESDFLFDAGNPDIQGRRYFHGKIEKEMAATPRYARTMEAQERLRKLYARSMQLDVDSESIGLPTLQKLSQISGHGKIRDVWGIGEKYGKEAVLQLSSGEIITPEDYKRIMTPYHFEGPTSKPYNQRRDAILEIVRNPNLTKDQIDKILIASDKSLGELKTSDNEGVPIDKAQFGKDYMGMMKGLIDNVDNETEFNRIYENLLMFFK